MDRFTGQSDLKPEPLAHPAKVKWLACYAWEM
jgi:hypothetical protein